MRARSLEPAGVQPADDRRRTLRLTPHRHLVLDLADDTPELDAALATRIAQAFSEGPGHGLLRLGAAEVGTVLPPVFAFWRELPLAKAGPAADKVLGSDGLSELFGLELDGGAPPLEALAKPLSRSSVHVSTRLPATRRAARGRPRASAAKGRRAAGATG